MGLVAPQQVESLPKLARDLRAALPVATEVGPYAAALLLRGDTPRIPPPPPPWSNVREFYHYGYAHEAAAFKEGLRRESYGTRDTIVVSGETAAELYGLPPDAAFLAARMAGRTVLIVGKNTCVRFSTGEDIEAINVQ